MVFIIVQEIGLESDYRILTQSGGSPAFQPPEVKAGGNASSPVKIDIWAIGITLYITHLFIHLLPFLSSFSSSLGPPFFPLFPNIIV